MQRDYLPNSDELLQSYTLNFSSIISDDPTSFGLTAAQATAYVAKQTAFAQALVLATSPQGRGPASTLLKNEAKTPLVAITREYVNILQNNPATTNIQRQALGIRIRKTKPSPRPSPETAPQIHVVSTMGRQVVVQLHSSDASRRGRPANTNGAVVLAYVGATPNTDLSQWMYMGQFSRMLCTLEFPDATPNGATVWITAQWVGTKMDTGPAAPPVPCNLPGNVTVAAKAA